MTEERVHEVSEWLVTAGSLDRLFLGESDSPWNKAEIRTGPQAQQMIDISQQAARDLWPEVDRRVVEVSGSTGLQRPGSFEEVDSMVHLLDAIGGLLDRYSGQLFQKDPRGLAKRLSPADRGPGLRIWKFLTDREYRGARRQLLTLRSSRAGTGTLLAEARAAAQCLEEWESRGGRETPHRSEAAEQLAVAWQAFSVAAEPLLAAIHRKELRGEPLDEAVSHLQALAEDARTPYKLPQVHDLRQRLLDADFGQLLRDLRESEVPAERWTDRLRYAWLQSALDLAYAEDHELATFDGRAHDRLVDEFRELDRKRLHLAADRVRRRHAEIAVAAMNAHRDETDLLRREAHKRSRHIPLRKLLTQAPNVATCVTPCWVASPLSVSQLLDARYRYFDVVLFDEASQVSQEDAISSLLRADQVVVAGDRHQLPPTTFFATQVEEEDEELAGEVVEGFESLLDTMAPFLPNWPLMWHYRSRDERLIAFSNEHIYDGRLITFPGTLQHEVISHELVPNDPALSGQTRSASKEVERVVDLVLEHAQERPRETLGVIAMGITHANRIQAELDRRLVELSPELADFFSLNREERFFVKNLETVQGDERDAIILSVGYGKAADGTLSHRFGPLTHQAGHRRLNVAVSRARLRMTLASSFHHQEVDLTRSGSRGVELLKAYIEYASNGGTTLPLLAQPDQVPLNPFEADIKDALQARGLKLQGQVGASHYRIDLVAMHPERPGRPVLAIECDGAAYHSSASARDRDRLRQEHLMRLGWQFHRIWSTDWFTRREDEIERAVAAFEQAVRRADILDAKSASRARQEAEAVARPKLTLRRTPPPRRGPPPNLPRYANIADYTGAELRHLALWAMSDGLLRTDEDLMREMLQALGFRRLGRRIRECFQRAIRTTRSSQQAHPL